MKIAIISDIHSNPNALLDVLEDIKHQKCDRVVCLGDIVGYGYDPNLCIDICRDKKIECFMGNHDAGLVGSLSLVWFNSFASNAIVKQRTIVSEENKDWLRLLPYSSIEREGYGTPEDKKFKMAFAHGELMSPKEFNYINGYSDAALEFSYIVEDNIRALFVGHTHFANVYTFDMSRQLNEVYVELDDAVDIPLEKWMCCIVNVGSVGYPRNQPYSIYGILDTDSRIFRHRILPFDFDSYERNMRESDMPIPLWLQSQKKRAEERRVLFR